MPCRNHYFAAVVSPISLPFLNGLTLRVVDSHCRFTENTREYILCETHRGDWGEADIHRACQRRSIRQEARGEKTKPSWILAR